MFEYLNPYFVKIRNISDGEFINQINPENKTLFSNMIKEIRKAGTAFCIKNRIMLKQNDKI